MPITIEQLDEIALTEEEYEQIVTLLGREPNNLELGLFGALWSEHCGYKHSKPLLGILPTKSPNILIPLGEENAGAIDIGDGQAIVMKIESHNHPSAIEPFQGAATGIGGIVRDILAMGAKPIALLNSLRFGSSDNERQSYLQNGIVNGISWYGNCIGIPNIGGEIVHSESYDENPLVNAMCVGLVETNAIMRASASGSGDLLILVGADTGRDGIHGASGLASQSFEADQELRTTVQVGNPFLEKVLINACLEVIAKHKDSISGVQDLGAAGLTSAVMECANKGNFGVVLNLDKVPRRENNMTPYEVMLSESQERMLFLVKNGMESPIIDIFKKWDLTSQIIGEITNTGIAEIYENGTLQANVKISNLVDAPQYKLKGIKPNRQYIIQGVAMHVTPLPNIKPSAILEKLLASPNIRSKKSVYRQYDHQVQNRTILTPGQADASILSLPKGKKGIALSVDGNGRMTEADPFVGGAISVAEACRNLSCVGAEPIAITDCLNFGNPKKLDIYYQLEECIKGIAHACEILETPVVSGNVSLFNESRGSAIHPTPIIGALGMISNIENRVSMGWKNPDDIIVLLGSTLQSSQPDSLAGSEVQNLLTNKIAGKPSINLILEKSVQELVRNFSQRQLINSAHDCSKGGMAITLAESSLLSNLGVHIHNDIPERWDACLFGETQSRIVISCSPEKLSEITSAAENVNVPYDVIGKVLGTNDFVIEGYIEQSIENMKSFWDTS
ncbi:MAG: phosphoribosylformylglycinamidine synthase II [Chloroflexi bacterium]|nr:phosphoribosylformylglycinamidine synthase II [Chloroflexota bacterium]|tara:strand:- start:536 stop:2737 length:2202 start_codon:yes stop_codon:yes gene_type:complete